MFSERLPIKDTQKLLLNPNSHHPITMFNFFRPQKVNLAPQTEIVHSKEKRYLSSRNKKNRELYFKLDLSRLSSEVNFGLPPSEQKLSFDNFFMPFNPYSYQVESVFRIAHAIQEGK